MSAIKLELLVMAVLYYISVVDMQERPSREFDFNDVFTLLQFGPCDEVLPILAIKTYADVQIPELSGRSSSFHLSNRGAASCMRTRETFDINESTEIVVAIHLKSTLTGDNSYVDVGVVDTLRGGQYSIGNLSVSYENWRVHHFYLYSSNEYAKIQISATMSPNATLAIEYLRIANPTTPTTQKTSPPTVAISTTPSPTVTTQIQAESTKKPWEWEVTTEQTASTPKEATEKPSARGPVNIFNIYSFASSYFNFTSKIIN